MNLLRVWTYDSNCHKLTDEDEDEDDRGQCRCAEEHVPEVGADGVQRRRVRHKGRRSQKADGDADLVTTETILKHACGRSYAAAAFPIQPQIMIMPIWSPQKQSLSTRVVGLMPLLHSPFNHRS